MEKIIVMTAEEYVLDHVVSSAEAYIGLIEKLHTEPSVEADLRYSKARTLLYSKAASTVERAFSNYAVMFESLSQREVAVTCWVLGICLAQSLLDL